MLGRLFDAEESAQLQQLKQNLTSNSVNTSTSKFYFKKKNLNLLC